MTSPAWSEISVTIFGVLQQVHGHAVPEDMTAPLACGPSDAACRMGPAQHPPDRDRPREWLEGRSHADKEGPGVRAGPTPTMTSPTSTGSGMDTRCEPLPRIRTSPACQSMSPSRIVMIFSPRRRSRAMVSSIAWSCRVMAGPSLAAARIRSTSSADRWRLGPGDRGPSLPAVIRQPRQHLRLIPARVASSTSSDAVSPR